MGRRAAGALLVLVLVLVLAGCGGPDEVVRTVGTEPEVPAGVRLQVDDGPEPGTYRVEAHGYEPGSQVAILVCLAADLPARLAAGKSEFDAGAACAQGAATLLFAGADGTVLEPAFRLQRLLRLPRGEVDCSSHEGGCAIVTATVSTRDHIAWQEVDGPVSVP